jgi:hypothetical protein
MQKNYPSIKKIQNLLNITTDQAKRVRGLIDGSITTPKILEFQEGYYHDSFEIDEILQEVSDTIEGFGVEYWNHVRDTYSNFYGLSYVNVGDCYVCTVIYNCKDCRFLVATIGDIVENNNNYL